MLVQFWYKDQRMWGYHLKQRGRWWHYYRAVPARFQDVEARKQICFSLKTTDFTEAKLRAAQFTMELESKWQGSVDLGKSLEGQNAARRYAAAAQAQLDRGFKPCAAKHLPDDDLLGRLRHLLASAEPVATQTAVLGLVDKPKLTMSNAFERFWDYIEDEWNGLSHDQRRVKRNGFLKAIANLKIAVGDIPMYDLERRHALKFRAWWLARLKEKGLKPHTVNKDFNSVRRIISTNFDMDGNELANPFAKIRLKDEPQQARAPFIDRQIRMMVDPVKVPKMAPDFRLLIQILVNTGMRPVEAIGLELEDIHLDHDVPHVHVRRNSVRGLKTAHSERLLPLIGVSLVAARRLVHQGGWGDRLGKNMYATSVINRHLRSAGIVTADNQSLYSLRHWFQDQLTKLDVVDRAQAQLMGHKFQRPKYGYGKDLADLKVIIDQFAIEVP